MAARILIFTSIPILLLYWKGIFNDVELPKSVFKTSINLQTKYSNKNEKRSSESIEFKIKSTSLHEVKNRGIHTFDFSSKTTNAVLSDLQIVDVIK